MQQQLREEVQRKLLKMPAYKMQAFFENLSDQALEALKYEWRNLWAFHKQLAPDYHFYHWLIIGGRGAGKTRAAAEWIRERVESGHAKRIALVGHTYDYARQMVEGPSGIVEVCPPWNKPVYTVSRRTVEWPNGARADLYSASEPDRLRGPQFDTAWTEDVEFWKHPSESWDMLHFGLRLGDNPRCVVTASKEDNPIANLIKDRPSTALTKLTTIDNIENTSSRFFSSYLAASIEKSTMPELLV